MKTLSSAPPARPALLALLALAALLAPLAAAPAAAENEIRRSLEAAPNGRVEIELFDGSIKVEGWDRSEVQVAARLSRPGDQLELERQGDAIEVEVESRDPGASRATLLIQVPRGSSVRLEVMSAGVEIGAVDGEIDIEAVAGDIRVSGKPRQVRAHTVTGAIEIETAGGEDLDLESVSGSIRVDAETRELSATTVAGSVRVRLRGISSGRFEAVSGGIDAEIVPAPRGRFDFESFSGGMILSVPAALSGRFELSSASGRVASKLQGGRERRDEDRLEIEQGSGEASFRLESFSGSIELRPLAKP